MATAIQEFAVTIDDFGTVFIAGTTTKVIEVVEAKMAHELTPEALQRELPHLSIAQIYVALAYYYANKAELDGQIAALTFFADELRRENPNPLTRTQLMARRTR